VKEKLQEYALIAEIVGAIAIVISLVFVGFQINQGNEATRLNTRAIEVSAYQDVARQYSELNIMFLENPEVRKINSKVRDGSTISTEEIPVVAHLHNLFIRNAELTFRQFQSGLIDEPTLYTAITPMRSWVLTRAGSIGWDSNKDNYDSGFVQYIVENVLDE